MTIEYVGDSLPPINREGSGRNNEFFTDEVLSKLRNDKGNWYVVSYSPWITILPDSDYDQKNHLRQTRLKYYMRGKYTSSKEPDIETAIRTEKGTPKENKRIVLYARSI
jgi:hypothetical protein